MFIRRFVLAFTAAAAISSAVAQTTTTTTTPTTRHVSLPPVGLGGTETIQINVANIAANSTAGTAASCTGTISFENAAGTVIGTATAFTVTTGQTFSARLLFGNSGAAAGSRPEIRGVIQITQSTATPRPPCSLLYSLETYDTTTGATHSVLTGGEAGLRN